MSVRTSHRYFVSFDKTPIHYISTTGQTAPKASLVLVHGAGEYAGRYREFPEYLAQKGYAVHAIDLRGYGDSGGARAYVSSFDDYAKDIAALVNHIKNEANVPLFLFGHSLGGLVASYTTAYQPQLSVRALILSSPCMALAFRVPGHVRLLARIMAFLWPSFLHKTPVEPQNLTHDREVIAEYLKDTKLLHRMSSRLYACMTEQMSRLAEIAAKIHCPVFIAQGGADHVVDPAASRRFYDLLSSKDKVFRLYEGLFHEVLNETTRNQPFQEILEWLEKHNSPS